MKKIFTIMISLVLFIFLMGCVNYKTQPANSNENPAEARLIDEIAKIEQEVKLAGKPTDASSGKKQEVEENKVEEEVVLPKLTEETVKNDQVDGEMQVIQVQENAMVKLNVKVSDPDQDAVQYSFSSPLNKLGQWKTNYGDAGEYVVSLTATDGKLTTEKKLKIVVERVNVPPQISGVTDLHVKEGEAVNFKPLVTDPNGDKVTVTVSDPLQSGNFATDHTSAGEYHLKVVASDGELQTEKTFTLVIDDVNELPILSNLADVKVKEGEIVRFDPVVSDLDNDPVKVTVSNPVGDSGVWKTSYTDHGDYLVTVTANDGKGTVTKKVKVVVEDVNMPPEIIEVKLAVN